VQRRALSVLFLAIALGFGGVAVAAARADRWVIAVAAGVLGLWMGGLASAGLRK
jgi:succinate-acetate transporter protein